MTRPATKLGGGKKMGGRGYVLGTEGLGQKENEPPEDRQGDTMVIRAGT